MNNESAILLYTSCRIILGRNIGVVYTSVYRTFSHTGYRLRKYSARRITILAIAADAAGRDQWMIARHNWVFILIILILAANTEPPQEKDEEKSKWDTYRDGHTTYFSCRGAMWSRRGARWRRRHTGWRWGYCHRRNSGAAASLLGCRRNRIEYFEAKSFISNWFLSRFLKMTTYMNISTTANKSPGGMVI